MIREASSDFLRIDISNGKTRKIISACQSDSVHRTVHFLLSNNGVPLDLSNIFSAEILIKRVNNTETDNPCIIDGDDISYTLKSNDISAIGENECHLLLVFDDGSQLETPTFYLNVFNSFYNQAALQSQNEYAALGQQVLDAKGYSDNAAASADSASEYADNASEYASEASEYAQSASEAASTAASEAASELNSTMSSYMASTSEYASQAHTYASEAHSYANAAASHKASTSEYMTSASEYASVASSEASVTSENVDSTSAYAASAAAKASEAAVSASEAANYMASTSEYVGSASEYASVAGSEASRTSNYMASTSELASEAGSEASVANSCASQAEYWAGQAESIAEAFQGALAPMGTITFSELPAIANAQPGWMYNISDEFTTTSDFMEGSGITVPAGSNVYLTAQNKWDILAGSPVTGVKGDNEVNYRKGNVNITKANIGLGNVRNEDIGDEDISDLGATVKAAILALNTSFSNALTALKNTAIAQAVGATGTTFASVITTLGTIVNRGSVTQSLDTTTTSYTVPEGYHDGTGTVSITTEEKSQTAGTSNVNVTPTSGKVLSKVVVSPTPSQSKTVTASRSDQTVSPDSGKLLSSVTVNKYPDASGTFTPTTHSTAADMGATNNYRYVDTTNAYNKGVADGRVGYIVTPTAKKTITANGDDIDVLNYAKVKVNVTDIVLPVFSCGLRYEYQGSAQYYYDFYYNIISSSTANPYCNHLVYNGTGYLINNEYIAVYQNNVGHSFTVTFKKKTWARINNTVGWHYANESITDNSMYEHGFDAYVYN